MLKTKVNNTDVWVNPTRVVTISTSKNSTRTPKTWRIVCNDGVNFETTDQDFIERLIAAINHGGSNPSGPGGDIEECSECNECNECGSNPEDSGDEPEPSTCMCRDLGSFTSIQMDTKYLYNVNYDIIKYDEATNYFKTNTLDLGHMGGMTVKKDSLFGHNHDGLYDDLANFIVRIPRQGTAIGDNTRSCYASISIAAGIPGMTPEHVAERSNDAFYKLIPFMVTSGINEEGLAAAIEETPSNGNITTGTMSSGYETEICSISLVRFVLDNFSSASQAATYIADHTNVFSPMVSDTERKEFHLMVSDGSVTKVVEFVGNHVQITTVGDSSVTKPVTADFNLYGSNLGQNGIESLSDLNHAMAQGAERYNTIFSQYSNITNANNMMQRLADTCKISNMYTSNPVWFSDYAYPYTKLGIEGLVDLTTTSDPDDTDVQFTINELKNMNTNKTREDANVKFTRYSIVYDLTEKSLIIVNDGKSSGAAEKFLMGDTDSSTDIILYVQETINNMLSQKQDKLVDGVNIKTINNESILITSPSDSTNITVTGAGTGDLNWDD